MGAGGRGRGRSRGRSRGRGRARDDLAVERDSDGEPEDVATTGKGAAETPLSGKLPPLGVDDLEQLVERYGAMGFHLPRSAKSFKPEDARLAFGAHDELWGFDKRDAPESRYGQHGARGAPVQHIHRPPMENVKYYCNMSDAALRELLALAPEERKLQIWSSAEPTVHRTLESRGYKEAAFSYMTDDRALPPIVDGNARPRTPEPDAEVCAPATLLVPTDMTSYARNAPAKPQIIAEFEDFVVVPSQGVYSPMRLWTLDTRNSLKWKSQSTNFGRRCIYYWFLNSAEGQSEALDSLSEKKLRDHADFVAWKDSISQEEMKKSYAHAIKKYNEKVAARASNTLGNM